MDRIVKVIVDKRELKSKVARELDKLNCDLQFETLEVGDYIVSDRVAFERKTTDDFLKSWIEDKKLFGQIFDLRLAYERPILLCEGIMDDLYTSRRIDIRAVQGCLATIASMGIPTLYALNPAESAQFIATIARREQTDDKRLPQAHGKRSHLSEDGQLEYIVSAIPGVGPQTAIDLLQQFETIERIACAGIGELQEIDGIGEITACAIRNVVTRRYKK